MHIKRNNSSKFWPIPRKGTKYLAVPSHNKKISITLILALRDILKIAKTAREAKKMLNEKSILINHRVIRDIKYPVSLFDIITIAKEKKSYKAMLSKTKKLILQEITEKSDSRVYKVLNKTILPAKLIQLNLSSGKNIISKEKVKTGDSVLIDLKENKIIKVIAFEKGRTAYVTNGAHMGNMGKINEIIERGGKTLAKISVDDKRINVWVKNIIVTE